MAAPLLVGRWGQHHGVVCPSDLTAAPAGIPNHSAQPCDSMERLAATRWGAGSKRSRMSALGPIGSVHLSIPRHLSLAGFPNTTVWPPSRCVPAIQSWTLRHRHARAPPIQAAVSNWNLAGSAHRPLRS